jgi:proteasome lid subunit RPN8/RPN11
VTDIASKLLSNLSDALAPGAPERCGLIGPRGGFIEVDNLHETPELGFHMDPSAFLSAVKSGAVATWHTHPGKDPNLSEEDMRGFKQWPQLKHYVVGIRDGEPTVVAFEVRDNIVVSWS